MSFPTYINFQVNNSGGGRSNMVVHSNAVILMLLSLFPEKFRDFFVCIHNWTTSNAYIILERSPTGVKPTFDSASFWR